jgi:hypothetical protein
MRPYKPDDNGARPIGYDTRDDFEQSREDLDKEGIDQPSDNEHGIDEETSSTDDTDVTESLSGSKSLKIMLK